MSKRPTIDKPKAAPTTTTTKKVTSKRSKPTVEEAPKVDRLAALEAENAALRAEADNKSKTQRKALPSFVSSFVVDDDGSYVMKGNFCEAVTYGNPFRKDAKITGQMLTDPDNRQPHRGCWIMHNGFGFAGLTPAIAEAKTK